MSTQTIARPNKTVTQPDIRRRPQLEPHSIQRHKRLPSIARRAAVRKPLKKKCCSQCDMVHPERAAISITKAVQETINGARPLPQLTRWVSAEVLNAVTRRTAITQRANAASKRTVVITNSRICRIKHDVVEGAVMISDGGRLRAAVIRLEAFRGRWRATYLQTM